MNTEIQPLINGALPSQVKRASVHKGWFVLVTIVVAIFCVAAIFHQQIGNLFGVHNAETESFTWGQIEQIDSKYLSKKWEWSEECSDDTEITLTIAVKQQNLDSIDSELMKVSDPTSSDYGKHWTFAQVHEFLAPHSDSLTKVYAWLNDNGIASEQIEQVTPYGDFLRFKTDVKTANSLLNTQYGYWKHSESGKTHMRVKESYYVPSDITQHLDFISPTLRFPVESHTHSMELIGTKDGIGSISSDTSYVTPASLKDLYGMGTVKGGLSSENVQVVASFLQEWFNDDDLEQFWDFFDITATSVSREPNTQPEGYGSEAELDVQYITSTGEGVQTIVWDVEDDLYFITLLTQIAKSDVTPTVVSMSYGGDEQSNGWGYSNRANIEFAKVGLLGITFLASSGDDGAISSSDSCGSFGEYTPSFPASSPYVTAVGGVTGGSSSNLAADGSGSTGEEAWYYSGGGFSTFFEAKSFQKDAVDAYFDTVSVLPNSERYNRYGAAYPDLSAQSVAYVICYESGYYAVSGTSCSCPSVAGMFSIINDIRLTAGKTRLGWLNPVLYSLYSEQSEYFNDVVSGYNMGCDDDGIAFYANSGWDPITGLGTPKFSKLLDAFYKVGTTSTDDDDDETQKSIFFY